MPSKRGPHLWWRLSNLEHPQADLDAIVQDHLLNHAIQVLLPYDTVDKELQEELDVQLVTMLPPDEGYQVIRASLADVLATVLNTAVLLQEDASLQAVSLAERLESSHAVAITPDGMLHMALSSEVHSRLGLTGASRATNPDRYDVAIDLKAKSMQPGGERYAQVLAKLRSCIAPQAFIARLEVKGQLQELGLPREALTPSYGTEAWMPLQSEQRTQPGLMLPPLGRDTFAAFGVTVEAPPPADAAASSEAPQPAGGEAAEAAQAEAAAGAADAAAGTAAAAANGTTRSAEQEWELRRAITGLHTWLGALACGLGHTACNDLLPDSIMPLQHDDLPLPTREEEERRILGTMVSRRWKGMLSQRQVSDVMKAAAKLVMDKRVPWAAVHVWGFADTPVAWRGAEHGAAWGGAGESGYTVVLMRGGDYCVFRPLAPA